MYGDGPRAGVASVYFNWKSWEPDNYANSEDCVIFDDVGWGDGNCANTFSFIVEFECLVSSGNNGDCSGMRILNR